MTYHSSHDEGGRKERKIDTFYRFGEPDVGKVHHAFRTLEDMKRFLRMMPERNLSPTYQITGKVVDDDGTPDGLQVLVNKYKRIKI